MIDAVPPLRWFDRLGPAAARGISVSRGTAVVGGAASVQRDVLAEPHRVEADRGRAVGEAAQAPEVHR